MADETRPDTPPRAPDSSIKLARWKKAVHFHRYGCPTCGHGVHRVVMEVHGPMADTEHMEFTGEAARVMWEMAESFAVGRER